ncbi:MAG: hypothetical protein ABSD74_15215 [Rhizomicrobium sp.]
MSDTSRKPRLAALYALVMTGVSFVAVGAASASVSVTTYHNDNTRSGWNQQETTLTPSSVSTGGFGLIASDALDDQVDTQPLVVPGLTINGSTHDVVYVATESDSIYAIDANSGQVLIHANFGAPVPQGDLPGGCGNNGPNIGIDGTPVIDTNAGVMYVITYTLENNNQTYRIHELSLTTLQDAIPSVVVSGSAKLNNGTTFNFPASQNRQRPGLLLSNGNIYAGFGSFCDIDANVSRGWVFGWQKGTLTPLAANHLNNTLASSQDDFFLTSIWMSGYGLAADTGGDIYFVTGNSDYSGNSYNKKTNLAESATSTAAIRISVRAASRSCRRSRAEKSPTSLSRQARTATSTFSTPTSSARTRSIWGATTSAAAGVANPIMSTRATTFRSSPAAAATSIITVSMFPENRSAVARPRAACRAGRIPGSSRRSRQMEPMTARQSSGRSAVRPTAIPRTSTSMPSTRTATTSIRG